MPRHDLPFLRFVLLITLASILSGCDSGSDDLLRAIRSQDLAAVERILSSEAIELDPPSDPNRVDKPLAYAAAYGTVEIVDLLLGAGADVNGKVAYGDVPLIKALERSNYDIALHLIERGADVNVPNAYGVSPLIGMCGEGHLTLVKVALEYGGDVDACYPTTLGEEAGKNNFSPLHAAVAYGRTEVVEFLVQHGADLSKKDFDGRTAREIAVAEGFQEIAAKPDDSATANP